MVQSDLLPSIVSKPPTKQFRMTKKSCTLSIFLDYLKMGDILGNSLYKRGGMVTSLRAYTVNPIYLPRSWFASIYLGLLDILVRERMINQNCSWNMGFTGCALNS